MTTDDLRSLIDDYGMGIMDDVKDFETVMRKVETGKTAKDFGSRDTVPILKENDNYYIKLRDFFENVDAYDSGEFLTPSELVHLADERDIWEYVQGDNSYNYNGYLEREVNFHTFKNLETDQTLVLFSIHIGLDIRVGYTDAFAVLFEDSYALTEFLYSPFVVATGTITYEDDEYRFSIDAEALSEFLTFDSDLYDTDFGGTLETYDIDLYDKEDLIQSIKDMLKEENVTVEAITID